MEGTIACKASKRIRLQDRLIQLWVRLIQIRVRLIQVQVRLIQDMKADSRGEEGGGKFGRGLVEVK